jgi:hypothetical protein
MLICMEHAAGPPTPWVVELNDGFSIDVWADSVTGRSGPDDVRDYAFGCLMDIDPELQDRFEVMARAPRDPHRVEVQVARFPRAAVTSLRSV